MKIIFTLVLVLSFMVAGCTTHEAKPAINTEELDFDSIMSGYTAGDWIEDYQAALKFSQELNKPILVNFTGSDWCGWCQKLSAEVFTQEEFVAYAKENFILLKIDFPSKIKQTDELKKQNSILQDKYKIEGYPTIILIDAKEKVLGRMGYQPGGAASYIKSLEKFIK